MHFGLGDNITVQAQLEFAVCLCLPFVLTQVFSPRMHQKDFQITILDFGVTEDPPSVRTVATPYTPILMDCCHELCFAFSNDRVLDRDQYRSLSKVSSKLLDDNRHTPVVPWRQISGGIGKPCE